MEVKNVEDARKITNGVIKRRKLLEEALNRVALAAEQGETSCKFMHDRKWRVGQEAYSPSIVACELRERGFQVNDSTNVCSTENNYRTIRINW